MSEARSAKATFSEALERRAEDRAAYLDAACAGDRALRVKVDELLAVYEDAGRFLTAPTVPGAAGPGSPSERPGAQIGPYRLLQEIGEGGFGTVYMAEQTQPVRRTVALKIIKLGMDTRAVIARFEAERQALAIMDHTHIARVLDAGATESGRPYFVMELVKGDPITTYCDRNNLTIADRLHLFVQVCHAVQHAHSKGVIHRDIKPTNVLVATQDGRPHAKVIDFGIAKATQQPLTEKTLFTGFRQLVGTPEYMSPEQAEGSLDIDTRTDVYGLGVLLYELLTGSTPFDARALRSAAYAEIQRIIREVEPPKPSTRLSESGTLQAVAAHRRTEPGRLSALVRGDLDWIVMRAMDKDRTRRYDTPSALAADIARYTAGEPVDAVPPSAGYRLRKFIRRHRVLVAAGAAVAGVLLLGVAGTSVGMVRANLAWAEEEVQRKAADANAARAGAAEAEADRRREAAEYDGYIANIESAYSALRLNDATRLRTRLDACPPERRNWEWRYLNAASDNSLLTMIHPRRNVQRVAYSADGSRLASTSGDGKVRIWDAATGTELAVLSASDRCWGDVDFTRDGALLLAPAMDGRIGVWDTATLEQTAVLAGHTGRVTRAFFLGDGSRIASASEDGTARQWDTRTGRELSVLTHQGPVWDAAPSPDGSRVATASDDQTVRLWGAEDGAEAIALRGHSAAVNSVRWSLDGARIVTASDDGTARVWDAATGLERCRLQDSARIMGAVFSPDGTRVVSWPISGDPRVSDAATGEPLLSLKGHSNRVCTARYRPDGAAILTGSLDNTVRVWDAATGAEVSCLRAHTETPWTAEFSPDGRRIVTGGDDTVRLWAVERGPAAGLIRSPMPDAMLVRLTPDGRTLLEIGVGRARLVDLESGRDTPLFPGSEFSGGGAISPDGSLAICAFLDGTVAGWNLRDGLRTLTLTGHTGRVVGIDFRADGERILTASADGTARVWDAASGRELLVLGGHQGGVNAASFDPAGQRIVTASDDRLVRLWDAQTGVLSRTLKWHDNAVLHAGFSPDGSRILSTSLEYTGRVWDAATGDRLFILKGHEHMVFSGMFSPDGSRVVTCANDGTARLWDAANGRPILALRAETGGMHTAMFNADGTKLLLGDTDGRAWVLDALPYRERFAQTRGPEPR